MRQRTVLVGLGVAALISSGCVPTNPSTIREVPPLASTCDDTNVPSSVTVAGRTAQLIAPADIDPTEPRPLLVSMHPFSMTAQDWENYSHLAASATDRGWYVLLPQGAEPGPRWSVPGGLASGTDDVGWIDALITETAKTVCVDSERVVAAGFSAGAALSVALSCELPGRFAAIAAASGANLTTPCPKAAPVATLLVHGTADGVVPLSGNTIPFTPPTGLHLDTVAATFSQRNGCGERPEAWQRSATVSVTTYDCEAAPLEDVRVLGMGHSWAGASSWIDLVVGPNDPTFSETNLVLDFLENA